ncbi:unnamed protein product [Gongylonema pulchrum]|uniref:Secreted protein n=1 Tax=Gongylonema pulchrum TaxID=637853 RepID=A0A183EEE0_9BILA|nr:unnamed protein product [Gongylonema pulchrum]
MGDRFAVGSLMSFGVWGLLAFSFVDPCDVACAIPRSPRSHVHQARQTVVHSQAAKGGCLGAAFFDHAKTRATFISHLLGNGPSRNSSNALPFGRTVDEFVLRGSKRIWLAAQCHCRLFITEEP